MKGIFDEYKLFYDVFKILSGCTDDYLFIFDFWENRYTISEKAVDVFNVPSADFYNADRVIEECVYPEDLQLLENNIQRIQTGFTKEHNLEYRWLSKNKNPIWISCRGSVIYESNGKAHYLVGRVSELGRKNRVDNITGLYREIALHQDIMDMKSESYDKSFMLLLGPDNFKDINERYDKKTGDIILAKLANVVYESSRNFAKVYRMSGDELMVFYEYQEGLPEMTAEKLYSIIKQRLEDELSCDDYQIFYTISGGSVSFEKEDVRNIAIIEKAEFALRQAKLNGKNMCVEYSLSDYNEYVEILEMQEEIRNCIKNNFKGFELYFQPIVDVQKKQVHGAEALLRWTSEKFGMISPAKFIPLLEDSGLIIPVGRWIIDTAMKQSVKWQEQCPGFRININLSSVQLKKSNIMKDIDDVMQENGVDSQTVLFEITESGELDSGFATQNLLKLFQRRKLQLAIDDFGTGYSNLRYIKEMMFNLIKIDQAFIKGIRNSQYDYMVVKQFTELAHSLNLKVCYEGVETKEDFECVRELNPDYIQGFYFARPVTTKVFEKEFLGKREIF